MGTFLAIAGTNLIPFCEVISGEVGNLEVDDSFRYKSIDLPINTLVLDLTLVVEEDGEFGESDFV